MVVRVDAHCEYSPEVMHGRQNFVLVDSLFPEVADVLDGCGC